MLKYKEIWIVGNLSKYFKLVFSFDSYIVNDSELVVYLFMISYRYIFIKKMHPCWKTQFMHVK